MITRLLKLRRMAAVFIFAFAVVISQFGGVEFAHATTTDTWTGAGDGASFSDASNWSGSAAPSNGDALTFDITSLTSQTVVNNDMTGLSVSGISFIGSNTHSASYQIHGNALTLTGSITNATSPSNATFANSITLGADITAQNVSFSGGVDTQGHSLGVSDTGYCYSVGQLAGSGAVTLSGDNNDTIALPTASPSYTGSITIDSGNVIAQAGALGDASGGTTVSGTGVLDLYATANSSWSEPFTLSGTGFIVPEHDTTDGCGGSSDSSVYTATLTGAVTLQSDFLYAGSDNLTVTGAYTDNGHSFTVRGGASGSLTLPSGTSQAQTETNTYSDDAPSTALSVGYLQTAILDGSRGAVDVANGGILMGNGTANSVNLELGGIIAPGHSPGKLTIVSTLSFQQGSTYQAQLKDSAAGDYDQIVVGQSSDNGTDVQIATGAILDTELYSGYSINQGDQFEIIDNQGQAAVSGTFSNLAEGAQFTVGNVTFSITYIGGDGNDVVLTALNTGSDPSGPNTSVARMIMANPAVVVVLGVVTAGFFTILAVRRRAVQR